MSAASKASQLNADNDHSTEAVDPVDELAESDSMSLQIRAGHKLFTVAKAFEELTGSRPHPTTICRMCRKGSSGIQLPSLIVRGRRMTSLEALDQWLRDVTAIRNAS